MMKAIVVAAGPGSRLNQYTSDKPKCLLDINGRTILERALASFRENTIDDIVVVRGYHSHLISYPNITYHQNPNFRNNNILRSLFYAEGEMNDDFVFSYSDIIYSREIVQNLIRSAADIALVVDTKWLERYEGRDQHPISEAELVKVENGNIVKIGKDVVSPEEAYGEFIGLAKFTTSGAEAMKAAFHRVAREQPNAPFHHAVCLEKAYLTDMIQELIDTGSLVKSVDIGSGWMEIDTPQDLERARKLFIS
ncbi:NTP transferase domain-containing protein [Chloroflexota bacterium]